MDLIDYMLVDSSTRRHTTDSEASTRANNIRDMFGVEAMKFNEYKSKHGGSGFWTAVGIAVGGLALGLAATLVIPAAIVGAGTVISAGLGLGIIGAILEVNHRESEQHKGYNAYLDHVAADARMAKERGPAQEYDNGAGRTRLFTEGVTASRGKAAAANR